MFPYQVTCFGDSHNAGFDYLIATIDQKEIVRDFSFNQSMIRLDGETLSVGDSYSKDLLYNSSSFFSLDGTLSFELSYSDIYNFSFHFSPHENDASGSVHVLSDGDPIQGLLDCEFQSVE
jgi:hypothetical protein